jgi:hypothetical protein
VKPFVSRVLGQQTYSIYTAILRFFFLVYLTSFYLSGMGDLSGLMDKTQDVMPADQLPEFVGQVSYRFIVSNLE